MPWTLGEPCVIWRVERVDGDACSSPRNNVWSPCPRPLPFDCVYAANVSDGQILPAIALCVALASLVISFMAFRLNRRAFRSGGHDVALDVDVMLIGPAEMRPYQPVHLIVDLFNRGRGPVTVVSMRLQFAPWDGIKHVPLSDAFLVSPPELRGRVEGSDHRRYVFDVGRAAHRWVVGEDTLPLWRIRRLQRMKGYPVWLVVVLGDGVTRRILLDQRAARMARQEVFGRRRKCRVVDQPFDPTSDPSVSLYDPQERVGNRINDQPVAPLSDSNHPRSDFDRSVTESDE